MLAPLTTGLHLCCYWPLSFVAIACTAAYPHRSTSTSYQFVLLFLSISSPNYLLPSLTFFLVKLYTRVKTSFIFFHHSHIDTQHCTSLPSFFFPHNFLALSLSHTHTTIQITWDTTMELPNPPKPRGPHRGPNHGDRIL